MNRTSWWARVDWLGYPMAMVCASLAMVAVTLYGPRDKAVRSILTVFAGVVVMNIVQIVRRRSVRPRPASDDSDDQDRAA
jgi:hypothetical protein